MTTWLDLELTSRLCLTLLHSLWQVALLALIAFVLDRLWRNRSIERRYAVHLAALVVALLVMPITLVLVDVPAVTRDSATEMVESTQRIAPPPTEMAETSAIGPSPPIASPLPPTDALTDAVAPVPSVATTPLAVPSVVTPTDEPQARWVRLTPWIAGIYALGVLVMLVRLMVSIAQAQRCVLRSHRITAGPLFDRLHELSQQWSLRIVPVLAQAERIVVPRIVGLLRPTILLPTAAINGLSPDELEMILLHELAHLRRHDLWANLLQRIAEVVLFFNPALWYLSRRISSLREYCCDEMTCRTSTIDDTTHRTRYATALVRVAELSQTAPRTTTTSELTTLAASGRSPSELRRRIAHLLGEPLSEPLGLSRGTVVATTLILLAALTLLSTSAQTADDDSTEPVEAETTTDEDGQTFSFGTQVKLLAIGDPDEARPAWWNAAGEPLEEVTFEWVESPSFAKNNGKWRRLLLRLNKLPEDAEVRWETERRNSWGATASFREEIEDSKLLARTVAFSEDDRTFGMRIGVATGPWKTVSQMSTTSSGSARFADATAFDNRSILYSGAFQTERGTTTVISHNDFDHNFRVVAIDKAGTMHESVSRGGTSSGEIYQTKPRFPGLSPADIDRFEFQIRDYEWVQIDNLPLHPNDGNKTSAIVPEEQDLSMRDTRPAKGSEFVFSDRTAHEDGQTYSFGSKVDVIAIGSHEEEPQRWWDSTGKPLASVPFSWKADSKDMQGAKLRRRVVFRINDLPEESDVLWHIDAHRSTAAKAIADDTESDEQYFSRSFVPKEDRTSTRLRIGVATGPWETVAQCGVAGTPIAEIIEQNRESEALTVTFSKALEEEYGTTVVASHNDSDHSVRVVAIDTKGKLHEPIGYGNADAGRRDAVKPLFPDLSPADIDRFEFQIRDYEWVQIDDLPLHPNSDDSAANVPARTLKFPEDRAMGTVQIKPASESGFGFEDDPWNGWQQLSLARGVVKIPSGQHVQLSISRAASVDLGPLADLPPDAIESLSLRKTDVTDDELAHIAHLIGLRFLNLDSTRITDEALSHLSNLHQLQTLYLSAYDVDPERYGVGDAGMKVIARLPALESIKLRRTKITNAGLADLAGCQTLRGVDLSETAVTDAGLVYLLDLPQLSWLGMRYYFDDSKITDEGLRTIAQMSSLRFLDLNGTPITDEGLQHLSVLTKLKRLSINDTHVTPEGLVHLAGMQDLENLYIYNTITDDSVKHVSRLKGLKQLSANLEISDESVALLATLPSLEYLSLSDPRITDAALADIARMPSLTTLLFQGCSITDRGLTRLRNLENLEHLMIARTDVTTAGLRHLMTLPNLNLLSLNLKAEAEPNWEHLKWFTQVQDLRLRGAAIHNADLRHLQGLPQLTQLNLELEEPIDDTGIAFLKPLTNLENLWINHSIVTDSGLASLSQMNDLERLNVSCMATNEGLLTLGDLDSLRFLQIASPYVTEQGIAALSNRLPSLQDVNHYDYQDHSSVYHTTITASRKDPFLRQGEAESRAAKDELEGKRPPAVIAEDWLNTAGKPRRLDDLNGQVVLVSFWEGLDDPTEKQELDKLERLYDTFHERGLEIIGVHNSYGPSFDEAWRVDKTITWPVCADVDNQTFSTWHVDSAPGYYLIDRTGTLRYADIFPGHLEEAVQSLLAEKRDDPTNVSGTPRTDDPDAEGVNIETDETVPLRIVIAKHVMLLEGKEIITWAQLEEKFAALPDPSLAHPQFYITRGATESGADKSFDEEFWGMRKQFGMNGHSIGSLWPRSDWRYDNIKTADDLVPDESLRVEGMVVDGEEEPVTGAEVILVTPVDESIPYKSYHMALVEGRVRNPLEHVLTHSDDAGGFVLYPPSDENYYVIALHPEHGFTLVGDTSFAKDHHVTLLRWGGLVAGFSEEPEQQVADLSTRITESDGRPEVVINQYWSDLKQENPTLTFGFTHVPPIFETTISRSFDNKDGGSTSVPGASVGLLPGETRRLDLGLLSKQQRESLEDTRERMDRRRKGAEETKVETGQAAETWKVRLKAIDQTTGETLSQATFQVELLYRESARNNESSHAANEAGEFVAGFETRTPDVCYLSCRAEGYAPMRGRWRSPEISEEGEALPEEVVFPMQKGTTVGGIVLNEDEQPVAGAIVQFSASNYGEIPGAQLVQTFSKDEFVTDENGRWSCLYAPEQMTEALFTVNHEDYAADDSNWGIQQDFTELKSQQLTYYLRRPQTIRGRVTDPDGKPVEGAFLVVDRTPDEEAPLVQTDSDGQYEITHVMRNRIAVIKPGFAPQERIFNDRKPNPFRLDRGRDSAPSVDVDFQLQPGVTVEIHVTDDEGKSLEGARVVPDDWVTDPEYRPSRLFMTTGQKFLQNETNKQGIWRWTWAPRGDPISYDVVLEGYNAARNIDVTANDAGQTVTVKLEANPSGSHILIGLVVDSETKQPIDRFVVQKGRTTKPGQRPVAPALNTERYGRGWVFWPPSSRVPGKDGRFLTGISVPFKEGKYVYRVLADGYSPAVCEPIINREGDPVLNVELEKLP